MHFSIVSCAIGVVIGMLCTGVMDNVRLAGLYRFKITKTTIDTLTADNSFKCSSLSDVEMNRNKNKITKTTTNTTIQLSILKGLKTISEFDVAAESLFEKTIHKDKPLPQRKNFDLSSWTMITKGGLTDHDRRLLAQIYRNAESVFEYGLGESTYIAAEVGVPWYAGVDSDLVWVSMVRNQSLPHFRFYFADIGATGNWGWPKISNPKNELNYQAVPLLSEPLPFDVYMVDGRWRVPIVALSFLHASARGANHTHTQVLLHDCFGNETLTDEKMKSFQAKRMMKYAKLQELFKIVNHSRSKLCVFKRKETTTNNDILMFWNENAKSPERL
jgi:hypothetical protein